MWETTFEKETEYEEQIAMAKYEGLILSLSAKIIPSKMMGIIECSITEKDMGNDKHSMIYFYRKRFSGFPEAVMSKLKNAVRVKMSDLEAIAKDEDLSSLQSL